MIALLGAAEASGRIASPDDAALTNETRTPCGRAGSGSIFFAARRTGRAKNAAGALPRCMSAL
jgi:hypothetical protein